MIAIGQQAQHDPVLITRRDDVQRRVRHATIAAERASLGSVLSIRPRSSSRTRADNFGWHIDHLLADADELLGEHRTHPRRSLDRPGARLEPCRPLQQPASLMPIGVDTDRVDDRLGAVDRDRSVGPLVRVDPDDEHDVLPVLVVGFAAAGTPDTCRCRSSYEPHRDRTWPDGRFAQKPTSRRQGIRETHPTRPPTLRNTASSLPHILHQGNLWGMAGSVSSLPLPDDPRLAAWASALNDAGHFGTLMDSQWRIVFQTDEWRLAVGDTGDSTAFPIGSHHFSTEAVDFRSRTLDSTGAPASGFRALGPYVLASTPGGRDELRRIVHPESADLVDELQPQELPVVLARRSVLTSAGVQVGTTVIMIRIEDSDEHLAGLCQVIKPAVGMSQLRSPPRS